MIETRKASLFVPGQRGPAPIAIALTLALCGAYAVQFQLHPDPDWLERLSLGANAGWLLEAGELFRLATANFVHASGGHFAVTTFCIASAAWPIESLFGSTRTLILALSGAFGGTLAAALATDQIIVGASTILFGIGAGGCVLCIDERPRTWLGPAIALGLVLLEHTLAPWRGQVSFESHLGGGVAGVAAAVLIHPKYARLSERSQRRVAAVGTIALLALLAWGAVALRRWDERALFAGAHNLYAHESPNPALVAEVAWQAYHSPHASTLDKEAARRALRRALQAATPAAYPFEVEGHLLEHEEDIAAALSAFHEALARDPREATAQTLGRLETSALRALPVTPEVAVPQAGEGPPLLIVESALGRGCLWHLLGRSGGATRAVIHLALGTGSPAPVTLTVPEPSALRDYTWHVALERCGDTPPEARAAHYWPIDPPGSPAAIHAPNEP